MPDAKEDAVKRLTDDEVANIRFDLVNSKPSPSPMGLFRQHCEDLLAEHDALCATVWALQDLAYVPKVLADDDEITYRDQTERLLRDNTALREQLAQSKSHLREQRETIKFWQRHIARMGKLLGTIAMDTEVEEAVKQLQSQLAQVTRERQLCLQVQKRGVHSSVACPCVIAMERSYESPQH